MLPMELNEISEMSFEQAMAALEQETRRLEGGELALADALKAYERGVALMAHAQTLLDTAQQALEVIDATGVSRRDLSEVLGSAT